MEQSFQCTQCTAKFPYQSSLLIHRARNHLHAGNVQNSSQSKSGDSGTPSKQATKNSSPLLNPRKRKVVQEETMKKSSSLKKNATTCIFCDKAFALRFVFENHMSTHTLERPYECSQCQANFGVNSALYTHQKHQHGKKSQLGSRGRRTFTKRVIPQELPKAEEEKDCGTLVEKEIVDISKSTSEHIAEIKLHKMSIRLERIQLPYKCQTVTDKTETVKQSTGEGETEENTDDNGSNEEEMELSLPIAESKVEGSQVDLINAPDEKPEVVAEGNFAESKIEVPVAVPEPESKKDEESHVPVCSIPSDCVVNTEKYDMTSDKDVNFESPVKKIESSVGTEVSYPCLFCRMSFRQKHRLTNHIGGNHRLSLAVALKILGTGYRGRNFM